MIVNFQFQRAAAAIVAAVFLLAGCGPRPASKDDFLLGVAASWNVETVTSARATGANALRGDVIWAGIEAEPGKFALPRETRLALEAARRQEIEPLGLLVYGNRFYDGGLYPTSPAGRAAYAAYADFAVGQLKDAVSLWEIWNEWNLAIGMPADTPPGSPEDYAALVRGTYRSLKARHPEKTFLGGAVAGIGRKDDWTRRACDAGLLQFLDGFSFHPYVYWMAPTKRVPERGLLSLVAELKALLAKYPSGTDVPLYITELGWPTHDGVEGVTLEQQAKYLSRAILLLRADSRIRGLWIYTLRDGDGAFTDRESHFGLMFADGSPKPAWFAFRDTAAELKNIKSCRRLDFPDYEDDLAGVEITDALGRQSLVIWAIDNEAVFQLDLRIASGALHSSVRTRVLGSGPGPTLSLEAAGEKAADRLLSVTVDDRPLVIENSGSLREVEWVDLVKPAN